MNDSTPHRRDADDARADDAPPTEAVTDDVKADAADTSSEESLEAPPEDPATTHP